MGCWIVRIICKKKECIIFLIIPFYFFNIDNKKMYIRMISEESCHTKDCRVKSTKNSALHHRNKYICFKLQ